MAHYIMIYDWMLELGLKGVEINAFAVIFSFWKEGKVFQGSASYLGKWMGVSSRNTVRSALNTLIRKGLVEKTERWRNGEKLCDYTCSKIAQGYSKTDQGTCSNIAHHNNRAESDSNKKEIKNKEVRLTPDEWRKAHR